MSSTTQKNILPIPPNFTVTENFGELIIEYKWDKISGIISIISSFIWNGVLFLMLPNLPSRFKYFIVLCVCIGIFLFYYGLCQVLNRTLIIATNDNLSLKSKPLPLVRSKFIAKSDIEQLYFKQYTTTTKNGTSTSYQLYSLNKNNKSTILLKTIPNPESARFIETKLEKFFKIKDLPVSGEFDKKN
jgi:hypothetical protein